MTEKAFLDLLDLQAVDTEIDRLLHRRETLPELDEFRATHEQLAALSRTVEEQHGALAETVSVIHKAEGELEITEKKRGAEEMRMFAGGMSSKDLSNLQLEVEMLGRRIDTAEEEIIELLDRRQEQEVALEATTAELADVETVSSRLEAAISEQWKEIDRQVAERRHQRAAFPPLIPDDLLELYEDLRPRKEGVGAARLVEGVCGGCHLSLSPAEQHQVLREDPPRCLQCRRILVPQ